MPDWFEGVQHQELSTPEAKEWLGKYTSQEEALAGGFNAAKAVGAPFRLPKSLESLPDDNMRSQFTSEVTKLLPVNKLVGAVEKDEDLKDINFAEGLADARTVSEELKTSFTKLISGMKNVPKSAIQPIITWWNQTSQAAVSKHIQDLQGKAQAASENTKTILNGLFGGEEGVKQHSEAVLRMVKNHMGLTDAESEALGASMMKEMLTDPIRARAMFNLAKSFKESSTEKGATQDGPKKESLADRQDKAMPIITGHLWPKKVG